jgi:hypothetical protein
LLLAGGRIRDDGGSGLGRLVAERESVKREEVAVRERVLQTGKLGCMGRGCERSSILQALASRQTGCCQVAVTLLVLLGFAEQRALGRCHEAYSPR